jgi:hypothetical protein
MLVLPTLIMLLQAPVQPPAPPQPTYDGRQAQVAVQPPRIEAAIAIDGSLDEPAWSRAALLRGFSQYLPVDGLPAADSTEVLVFYSKRALYIGIRAYEAHGAVHATLADRDKITADDYVQILLDTSHDHKRAYVFGVNPLGIQADGILNEGIQNHTTGFTAAPVRDTVDLSTDFTYESRGRVTAWGYEVEVRIPFSSISFTSGGVQQWRINVVRQVQHSGYQDTWAPARLANASFIGQFGTLDGMTNIGRGLVLDVNPELTDHIDGSPTSNGWKYSVQPLQLGGNLRWGITDNLTLDGTVRPDFSQIEADVPVLQYDPRVTVFYPEKRPFFLDGLEQFDTPNTLIYTRQIVQPDAAVKLVGELGGTSVGFLSAEDGTIGSTNGTTHPFFDILRVHRNFGSALTVGVMAADREEGGLYNRIAGADARLLFGGIYDVRLQGVVASSLTDSLRGTGPLWDAVFERNGRHFRMHYEITGIDSTFVDQSGYIPRAGIVTTTLDNSLTLYGSPGALLESYTFDFTASQTWDYTKFVRAQSVEDVKWHFSNSVSLRGGWSLWGDVFVESFGYDPDLYQNYYIAEPTATGIDTVPYVGQPHLPNLDIVTGFTTPRWSGFDASIQTVTGYDDNFYEWSSAWIFLVNATIDWRPTDRGRVSLIYSQQQWVRRSDNTQVAVQRVPYLEIAYQLSRPIYVRFIGEYSASWVDALRDDGRTNDPILMRNPATNTFSPSVRTITNAVTGQWLFSYQPTPGTVAFVGYNAGYTEPWSFNFTGLRRTTDGFFVKFSYLFHVGNGR